MPTADLVGQAVPSAAYFLYGKVLAARAHVEGDESGALGRAFDALEASAREADRADQLRALALDRAHLMVAAAARARQRGEAIDVDFGRVRALLQADIAAGNATGGALGAAIGRVLLASAMATLEQAEPDSVAASGAMR